MLEEAINYPRNGEEWVKNVLVGSVLTLFWFLVVPAIVVFGYYVRVMRGSMAGEEEPPEFDEWGDLLADGLKAFVVTFVYMLVPAIVLGVSVGSLAAAALTDGGVRVGAILGALGGLTVSALLSLVFWYIVPAAVANVARTGTIASGFAFGELRPALTSGKYAVPWLLSIGVLVGAGVVTGILNVVPVVGFVLSIPVTFYATVVAFYLTAQGFEEATNGRREGSEESSSAQPVA